MLERLLFGDHLALLFFHHLHHLRVALVSPSHEGSLLLPGVHVGEHDCPVSLSVLELISVDTPRCEDAADAPLLKCSAKLLDTAVILFLLLGVQDPSFVQVKGLSKELFPHLPDDKVAPVFHGNFGVN